MSIQTLIKIVEGSEENRFICINQEDQNYDIQIQGITANYCLPSGKWDHGNIILLYEPKSELFGWYFAASYSEKMTNLSFSKEAVNRFIEDNQVYLSSTKMVFFIPRLASNICFKEFKERYASLEEARKKLLITLEKQLKEVKQRYFDIPYSEIPIGTHLNSRFFRSYEKRMFREADIKITRITYHNSQWKIELESTDEAHPIVHKYGTFLLDENYNVIEVLGDAASE